MLISLVHTFFEVVIILAILKTVQVWLVNNNPESGGAQVLSFLLG